MEINQDVDKYRPVRTRGLRATDLDRRQEQARVQNHGHQVLLQSKLGKLDSREKRSVKDIRRKTESMLDMLKNIQITTPRVGVAENAGALKGGIGATASSMSKRRSIVQVSQQERLDSIPKVGNCNLHDDSAVQDTTHDAPVANVHLPCLPSGPQGQRYRMRRRYSANDALAASLERFHAYKAGIVKCPSAETIHEHDDSGIERDISNETSSKSNLIHRSESFPSKSPTECFGESSPRSLLQRRNRPLTARTKLEVQAHNEFARELYSENHSTSTPSSKTLSSSMSCPAAISVAALPFLKAETTHGKRSENSIDDSQGEGEEEIHSLGSRQRMEHALLAARRQSLSASPATFRILNARQGRRNSSPDVFGAATSLNQRTTTMTSQRSPITANRGLAFRRSEDLDLNARLKAFLAKTDSFIQSSTSSSSSSSSSDQQLPKIGQIDLANPPD